MGGTFGAAAAASSILRLERSGAYVYLLSTTSLRLNTDREKSTSRKHSYLRNACQNGVTAANGS